MDIKPPVRSPRLSGTDAAFLYLERKEIPLNIAAVGVFDGPIPFREFVANIDSRLDLVPRYRQVAVLPPFNLGYPTWEYDPNFNIKRHILRVRLPDAPGARRSWKHWPGGCSARCWTAASLSGRFMSSTDCRMDGAR